MAFSASITRTSQQSLQEVSIPATERSQCHELKSAEQLPVPQKQVFIHSYAVTIGKRKFWAKYQTTVSGGQFSIKEHQNKSKRISSSIKVYQINIKDVRAELKAAGQN